MRKSRFESREKSSLVPCALLAILLLVPGGSAAAQSAAKGSGDSKEPTASISGRVTVEGKPLSGVIVSVGSGNSPGGGLGRSTTDADGRYTISGVPAGQYSVSPFAPAMVLPSDTPFGQPGKTVNVADGEVIEKIDFAMIRGGVMTGRVTDSNGRPVVAQRVQISQLDDQGRKHSLFGMNQNIYQTDDRGIYRVYGLSPGRYVVSTGRGAPGEVSAGSGHAYYPFTYHPGVTDESRAGIVDITAGTEAINIDIPLGKPEVSYTATGHVVDADSGTPVPDVQIGYSSVAATARGSSNGQRTGFDGEFRIEGVIPGRYSAFATGDDDHDIYSDLTPFDVVDADVRGVEVKVRRGGSVTGVAVIEGASDPAVLEKLSQLRIFVMPASPQPITSPRWVNAAADGSFIIKGLGPGKIRISLAGMPKGLSLSRVDKDGADQTGGIDVGAGEQVTGVRMVLVYGSCTINGSVRVEGGPLPDNTQMFISVRRVSAGPTQQNRGATVDARGRFSIEGLAPGEYVLTLNTYINSYPIPPRPSRGPAVQKTVAVTGESDPEVTLVLNVPPSGQNNQQ
jgi:protocatechuate 3,4-dioxygenase beta subunit